EANSFCSSILIAPAFLSWGRCFEHSPVAKAVDKSVPLSSEQQLRWPEGESSRGNETSGLPPSLVWRSLGKGGFIFDWETVKQIGPLYCNISGFALSGESLLSWQK
ncbi:hypothetical protein P2Q70_23485, partial [Pseudomonas mendocina]|uniref:hypothetical protein n=1 Tax=Ectopseudomonas mendocina TaxID=300 RepID=UPI0023DCBB93